MQIEGKDFGQVLTLPDTWQRKALNLLRQGDDLVLHAPTGAGKTYVFELLVESAWKGRAVYTVPTRALANDKFREWQERGWDVGLVTGDLRHKTDASIVVATLETQRSAILTGELPDLLVVDEYQLLADEGRGPGYEVALAMLPTSVTLLLMSGSVANPQEVADWLSTHGRSVSVIFEIRRPVPLEEVFVEAILKNPFHGRKVRGKWPKLIEGALRLGLGPILVFAPRRRAAEEIAQQLAHELPEVDPLELTGEQKKILGKELIGLIKRRVAYHHSGLDYLQRAGVIEPLAKRGQLQVVVATTGLGAGVNFSMRSILVADREYRVDDRILQLRPDELLQMFGRAGRRGFDDRGFVIVAPKQARLADARPLKLTRSTSLDWPAIIGVILQAKRMKQDHIQAARDLARKLFSEDRIRLGLGDSLGHLSDYITANASQPAEDEDSQRDQVVEMRNSAGLWERRGGKCQAKLGEALILSKGEWVKALTLPDTLSKVRVGNPCRFGNKKDRVYGREIPIGVLESEENPQKVILIKSFRKKLRDAVAEEPAKRRKSITRKVWVRSRLEQSLSRFLPVLSQGGTVDEFILRGKVLRARLRYDQATILGWRDNRGKVLINPTLRKVRRIYDSPFKEGSADSKVNLDDLSPAEAWFKLGLIDAECVPTPRGEIFSLFHGGEGLAVAVSLEDETYPVDEIVEDLANLRAGHRFSSFADSDSRMALVCREAFGFSDCTGYLKAGLPVEYGEGAVEALANGEQLLANGVADMEFSHGDLERLDIEWRSLLRLIAHAPKLDTPRWSDLQEAALRVIGPLTGPMDALPEFPELPERQRHRYASKTSEFKNI